jgi:hypothetical protein
VLYSRNPLADFIEAIAHSLSRHKRHLQRTVQSLAANGNCGLRSGPPTSFVGYLGTVEQAHKWTVAATEESQRCNKIPP